MTLLILNLMLVILLLAVADYGVRTFVPGASLGTRYVIALALVIATPLPNLSLIGMEHVDQTLSVLLHFLFASQVLSLQLDVALGRGRAARLLAAAVFAGSIRYEAVIAVSM